MNAKSKVFSLLVAIVLSLSMFGGATAQQSDSATTKVTLWEQGTWCTVNLLQAAGNFGYWEFDGTQYVAKTATTVNFATDVYGGGQAGCNVTVQFGGLSNLTGGIPTSSFTAYSYFRLADVPPAGFSDLVPSGLNGTTSTGMSVSFYDFYYTLVSVPASLTPGVYEGGLYVGVSNAV